MSTRSYTIPAIMAFALLATLFVHTATAANLINWNQGQGTLIDSMNAINSTGGNPLLGWAPGYAGSVVTLNTSTYVEGNSSVSLTIPTGTASGAIVKYYSGNGLNLGTPSNLYFWIYVNNRNDLAPATTSATSALSLYLFNGTNYFFLCKIESGQLQSGWNPVVVAATSACTSNVIGKTSWSNITSIQIAVSTNSSNTQNTTVELDNLRYGYGGGVFGKAEVILTFDGSWNSQILNASSIMAANHQSGVAFIVTNQIGENQSNEGAFGSNDDCGKSATTNTANPCITVAQMAQLYNMGWDVGSHTADHANLVTRTADIFPTPGSTNNTYELAAAYATLVNLGFGRTASIFAYPNGAYNATVIGMVEGNNYIIARALELGITQPNMFPNDPYNLSYRIQSVPMAPFITANKAIGYINNAIAENGLLVFTFHTLTIAPCTGNATLGNCLNVSNAYPISNFTAISNYLNTEQMAGKLQVTNFSAYYSALGVAPGNPTPTAFAIASPNASPQTVVIGNTVTISDTGAIGGSGHYLYQWFERAPSANSLSNMTDCANAIITTCTFSTTANTALGNYIFAIQAKDVATANVLNSTPVTVTVTNTTTTTTVNVTTTVPPSTGGGGGGGGFTGGAVGTPAIQTVSYTNTTSNQTGFEVVNFTQYSTTTFVIGGKVFSVTLNFITPSSIGFTANGHSYNITPGQTLVLNDPPGYAYYAKLTSISYVPSSHSADLYIYEAPLASNTTNTTTAPTNSTVSTVPTSIATTTIPQPVNATTPTSSAATTTVNATPPPSTSSNNGKYLIAVVAVVVVVVAAVAYAASRKKGQGGGSKKRKRKVNRRR